ncbi:MAG: hypothetical protein ACWA5R_02610 [bacterium]
MQIKTTCFKKQLCIAIASSIFGCVAYAKTPEFNSHFLQYSDSLSDLPIAELTPHAVLNRNPDFNGTQTRLAFWKYAETQLMPGFMRQTSLAIQNDIRTFIQPTLALESFNNSEGWWSSQIDSSYLQLGEVAPISRSLLSQLNNEVSFANMVQSTWVQTYNHKIGNHSTWGLSAVVANQRIDQLNNQITFPDNSSQYGAGIRLELRSGINQFIEIGASYQTKIDLDANQSIRDFQNKAADFDIPGFASVSIALKPSGHHSLVIDAQRILYSEISPFTGYILPLPDRFLSLLGDGGSPDFNFGDRTVYNIAWHYNGDNGLLLSVGYGTGNNPEPASALLSRALAPNFANYNIAAGVAYQTQSSGKFGFNALYAPQNFAYSGNNTTVDTEYTASWSFNF